MTTTSGSTSHLGLTSAQAARLLSEHGRNELNEHRIGWPTRIAARFCAPVPWMLEAAIALQLTAANMSKRALSACYWRSMPRPVYFRKSRQTVSSMH
ncbi:cation-transporting P-type ATPase [Paraburkholderia sp. WSM4179]|uniref:cation-transporting P-type ATPase n=1 Tax=Paraburkholderia sp. WSM4179 TaxID=2991073 RepID=UPI00039D748A|nr:MULTISPECIES: cation-transporting P-type ATPase [Paraburkholderia]